MAEELQVEGKVENGIIFLTVRFDQELLLKTEAYERLSKELKESYQKKRKEAPQTTSCIVKIEPDVAGSPLVRGLFDLWKEVRKEGGQVICVNYPPDYIASLTSLGLPALPGFSLAGTQEEAIQRLTQK